MSANGNSCHASFSAGEFRGEYKENIKFLLANGVLSAIEPRVCFWFETQLSQPIVMDGILGCGGRLLTDILHSNPAIKEKSVTFEFGGGNLGSGSMIVGEKKLEEGEEIRWVSLVDLGGDYSKWVVRLMGASIEGLPEEKQKAVDGYLKGISMNTIVDTGHHVIGLPAMLMPFFLETLLEANPDFKATMEEMRMRYFRQDEYTFHLPCRLNIPTITFSLAALGDSSTLHDFSFTKEDLFYPTDDGEECLLPLSGQSAFGRAFLRKYPATFDVVKNAVGFRVSI
uniref:Peptidase A1 domain-containing protein n=1 Tax=Chromera velia CCMP2878 TaxID=1169474 RepID=A0A0G4GSF5_9ALVE|eukprot:Cvel_5124.t1-p1 / transcript=Cvel_5124.t1 / gene=Cvel_5124 / organism=Chromera_velia_CCMP2878 / gene_product=hypothetical protein / transcript_product=hypothetical protein / location=Cvel_scaffold234:55087-55932(-) / protein_length=282 / sequence_SO=supercontig / SO=protein_coding / is_pseudo=false